MLVFVVKLETLLKVVNQLQLLCHLSDKIIANFI